MTRFLLLVGLFVLPYNLACAGEVVISQEACRWLTRHSPAPDVEYEEGVDVHGKAVVSAEIEKVNPLPLPETIHVPLNVELAQFLGLPLSYLEQKAYVGVVSLGPEGLLYNGAPLQSSDGLVAYCDAPSSVQ